MQRLVSRRDRRSGPFPRGRESVSFGIAAHSSLTLWTLLVVLPLLWVVMSSFKSTSEVLSQPLAFPSALRTENYTNAWTVSGVGGYFLNTVVVVGCALVMVMICGAMCAYVLARFRFRGNRLIYYSMVAALTFPVFLAIVPLFFILQGFGLLNTLPGLVVTYVAYAMPFTVFFLHAFFRALPQELSEAAMIDGAGEWRIFFQVMLPMARPGMASVAIFNFLGLWNQFLLPVALNTNEENYVLTQGMARFQSDAGYALDFGALFAAVVISIAPVLVAYVAFQRQLTNSVAVGALK